MENALACEEIDSFLKIPSEEEKKRKASQRLEKLKELKQSKGFGKVKEWQGFDEAIRFLAANNWKIQLDSKDTNELAIDRLEALAESNLTLAELRKTYITDREKLECSAEDELSDVENDLSEDKLSGSESKLPVFEVPPNLDDLSIDNF